MAKITRGELKKILKECLREILKEEGMLVEAKKRQPAPAATPTGERTAIRKELRQRMNSEAHVANPRLMEHVNSLAAAVGDSSKVDMMRTLLEDTANTTLQEQLEMGSGVARGLVLPPTEKQTREDLEAVQSLALDGDVTHWAKIAFANKS